MFSKNVKKVDEKIFNIKKEIDYLNYFNPVNFDREKEIFFEKFYNGNIYNPIFKYNTISLTKYNKLKRCINNLDLSNLKNKSLVKIFKFYKEDLRNRLELIYSVGDDRKIFNAAKKVFGIVEDDKFELSMDNVRKVNSLFPKNKYDVQISKDEFLDKVKKVFKDNKIDWDVQFREEGAFASVDTAKKILFLKTGDGWYSNLFVDILIAHEIMGHIRQSVEAKKIGLKIFETGFGYYELIHEGWALYNEEDKNSEVKNRIYIYYIATYIASNKSFYETFCFLLKFIDTENAYAMTARVKRGFEDTSTKGSFLKDKAYLEGYLDVMSMNMETLDMVGKAIFDLRYKKEVIDVIYLGKNSKKTKNT